MPNKAMKSTRLIALLLAILTASSLFACNSEDKDDTTTPAVTTTQEKPAGTDAPETPDDPDTPTVDAETPIVDADALTELKRTGSDLRDLVTDTAVGENMTPWGDGPAANLFDGNTASTKLGGDVTDNGDVTITWSTSVATTVSAYILYTGNDSENYPGRTPLAWEFSGSTDGENWTIIDKVTASAMEDKNATPYGYTVDEPAAYTSYKLYITEHTPEENDEDTTKYLLQLNEMILIGSAEMEAETPVTDAAELDALIAGGTDLREHIASVKVSANMTPWNDGPAENLFDGNTTSTKLGGDVPGNGTVDITFTTDVATTLTSYILYTGNDSGNYPGRTPTAWVLYGTSGAGWTILDRVGNSAMEDKNATPYGYTIDNPIACTTYKLTILSHTPEDNDEDATKYLLQLNELIPVGTVAAE